MKKLLIVEDNEAILKGLKYSLEKENFEIKISKDVATSKKILDVEKFDLIILDITLPDGNGFELCKFIKQKMETAVIFLTAKDEEQDVVLGLDIGADDYIIKPFRIRELISRINNVLRRSSNNHLISCGKVELDIDAKRIYIDKKEVIFTALEYKILLFLFTNINKTITREQILDKIWDVAGNFVNDNTLTVYIKRIREKLGTEDIIKTIKGIGYRVES